jgi:hypothetical protein
VPGNIAPATVASGALSHAGYAGALAGGNETTAAPTWASGYMVPARSQLVLYVTRPRVAPPKAYVYQDLFNGRGSRIQSLNRDLWLTSGSTFPCGSNGSTSAFCGVWNAKRHTTELMSAAQSFSGRLEMLSMGGVGGEATYAHGLSLTGGVTY